MVIDVGSVTYLPFCFSHILAEFESNALTYAALWQSVALFGGVALLTKTCAFIQDLLFFPVINITIRDLNMRLVKHMHAMSMHDYDQLSIPEIISFQKRMGMAVRFFMRACLISVVPTILKSVFALSVIWSLGFFRVGLVVGIVLLIFFFCYATKWYLTARRESWVITDRVTAALSDSILNTKYARFFTSFEIKRVETLIFEEARSWFRATMRMDAAQIALGLVMGGILASLVGSAAWAVYAGVLTIAQLVLVKGQVVTLLVPMRQMLMDARQISEASVDLEHIMHVLQKPLEERALSQHITILNPRSLLEIQNLTFAYAGKGPIFQDFSLCIPHKHTHQTIVIRGDSGIGKSTLFQLICGLIPAQSGHINLLGMDVWASGPSVLGQHIHLIPQDVFLFNGTLLANIAYGVDHPSYDEINHVVEAVGLSPLITRLPKGLETRVGSMGAHLSGGERQRVAFARALLHKPKILLFDETTNALDLASEISIMQAVQRAIPSVLMISHKSHHPFPINHIVDLNNKSSLSRIFIENPSYLFNCIETGS